MSKLTNIIKSQLDIPSYKVQYALRTGMLKGAYQVLTKYGITLTDETFQLFFDLVGEKLSGSPDIEYEWTEEEYTAMMNIKQYAEYK
jgi:hypothetical protein